jgi:hypothetical protein
MTIVNQNHIALVEQVDGLLRTDGYEADIGQEHEHAALIEQIRSMCERLDTDARAANVIHRILGNIYQVHVTVPLPNQTTGEESSVLNSIQVIIERAFLASEERQVDPTVLTTMPTEPASYKAWFFDMIHSHPAYTHQLYKEYLAQHGTAEDLRYLLVQESTIDAATDDFIALMQVGMRGRPKMEMATNYWDEMGNGRPEAVHSLLFDNALRQFGISLAKPEVPLETEALACGNLQLMLGLRRKHVHKGIGYFAVVEYMAPARFTKLMEAWDRLELGRDGADYHLVHIDVDQGHAEGWFENVVLPLITEDPAVIPEITRGALYRLNTSCRYLDRIFPSFPSRQDAVTKTPVAAGGA